jgi:MarR family transcriptional regulator, temperature-dependent positive regulator of motility
MNLQREQAREDAQFQVMRLLASDPTLSQRQLADALGISLGATHYVLRGLIDSGFIKLDRFRGAADKRRYAYVLTPGGLAAKGVIARRFLARKRAEYAALQREIAELGAELHQISPDKDDGPSDRNGCA